MGACSCIPKQRNVSGFLIAFQNNAVVLRQAKGVTKMMPPNCIQVAIGPGEFNWMLEIRKPLVGLLQVTSEYH